MKLRITIFLACLLFLGMGPSVSEAMAAGSYDEIEESEFDPFEPVNRVVFEINHRILWFTARPIAKAYRWGVPEPLRDGFRNILDNLGSPLVLGNQLLQGDVPMATRTFSRLVINSTLGVGGAIDVARRLDMPKREADLGMTLAGWGVGEGPYLVLPLLGPAIPRDSVGSFAQGFVDPFNFLVQDTDYAFTAFLIRFVLGNIDLYSRVMDDLDEIEESSIDFYAALRNLYLQERRAQLRQRFSLGKVEPIGIDYGIGNFDEELPADPDTDATSSF